MRSSCLIGKARDSSLLPKLVSTFNYAYPVDCDLPSGLSKHLESLYTYLLNFSDLYTSNACLFSAFLVSLFLVPQDQDPIETHSLDPFLGPQASLPNSSSMRRSRA